MCSIGGWISTTPLDPARATELTSALIWYGSDRGQQSAGVYSNGQIVKRAMHPEKFIAIKAFRTLMEEPSTLVLTHTRQPTCGGLGDPQAQPFRSGPAITVHNGMLSNTKDLKAKFGLDKPSGVDSELFATFVAAHGPEELTDFCAAAYGSLAVACVYNEKLYVLRESSPLTTMHIKMTDGNDLTVFASTPSILRAAIGHVFLIPSTYSTKEPDWGDLYALQATGLTKVRERTLKGRGGYTGGSYGGHSASSDYGCGRTTKNEELDMEIWVPGTGLRRKEWPHKGD